MHMANYCQSCDMPLAKDPEGGGTEVGAAQSAEYCSLCYKIGAFMYQGDDVKAFQSYVVNQMVRDGWMRPIALLFTRRIPKLKRWA
jgi:hypothetical protein